MTSQDAKFTFKTEKATGRYRFLLTRITLNKVECGIITNKKPHKIKLQVIKEDINEDGNKNCEWKWITLEKESESLQEAKSFMNESFKEITSKYKIYIGE